MRFRRNWRTERLRQPFIQYCFCGNKQCAINSTINLISVSRFCLECKMQYRKSIFCIFLQKLISLRNKSEKMPWENGRKSSRGQNAAWIDAMFSMCELNARWIWIEIAYSWIFGQYTNTRCCTNCALIMR